MLNNIEKFLKKEMENNNKKIIFLCIGSNKCIGDSLGPKVGENLCRRINTSDIYIFGNLKNNITYNNVNVILNKINTTIEDPFFIVVDSALATKEYLGQIVITKNKMVIGKALNKLNYSIGDLCIKGIVGENKNNCLKNYKELNNVSINLINRISLNISNKILEILNV